MAAERLPILSFAAINGFSCAQRNQAPNNSPKSPGLYEAAAVLVMRLVFEPFQFILQTQFLTLQFRDSEHIGRWPSLLFVDLAIQCAVPLRQFHEVCV